MGKKSKKKKDKTKKRKEATHSEVSTPINHEKKPAIVEDVKKGTKDVESKKRPNDFVLIRGRRKPKVDKSTKTRRIQSIKKMLLPSVFGTAGGIFLGMLTINGTHITTIIFLIFLMVMVYAQKIIFPKIDVDPLEFEAKDWIYIGFMTLDFLLVVWTLFINANPITTTGL
ncbi:MAG: EMC6-like membrane protein [Methermicoccaceae archaeon]